MLKSAPLLRFLESAGKAGEPVLLLVNDPHRSTQTRPVLTALAKLAGDLTARPVESMTALRFHVLVATGTHRFDYQTREGFEQATFAGCGLNIESVTWHDASDETSLADIAGVRLHRLIAEGRFLLPIGSVEPHYFAGVTGPHKTLTVGCMSHEDIERNHAGALDPSSDVLRLEGNPVFDDIAAVLRGLASAGKTICAVGEIVCDGALVDAAVGDPIAVVHELLPAVRRTFVHQVERPVDVLHLRVPPPLGCNLYQADKAFKNNHLAVRNGGGIILEADCVEGIGPDVFLNLLRESNDLATALHIVQQRGYRLGDHKAVKLRHLMDRAHRNVSIALVSPHLSESQLADTQIVRFGDVESAKEWLARETTGTLDYGLIIDDAGMVCVTPASG